jgi:hypothetical protein
MDYCRLLASFFSAPWLEPGPQRAWEARACFATGAGSFRKYVQKGKASKAAENWLTTLGLKRLASRLCFEIVALRL